jgi:hypothetical protein
VTRLFLTVFASADSFCLQNILSDKILFKKIKIKCTFFGFGSFALFALGGDGGAGASMRCKQTKTISEEKKKVFFYFASCASFLFFLSGGFERSCCDRHRHGPLSNERLPKQDLINICHLSFSFSHLLHIFVFPCAGQHFQQLCRAWSLLVILSQNKNQL